VAVSAAARPAFTQCLKKGISSMTDKIAVTNLPDSGSSERVAFDLLKTISFKETDLTKDRSYYLDLYAECLHVTRHGFRQE
jgi:hypothetical protein